jgi:hypothetical protein
MPLLIRDVVEALAELKEITAREITQTVESNFARCIQGDPCLSETYARFFAQVHEAA